MLKWSMGRSLPFSRASWVSAVLQGSVSAVLKGEEVAGRSSALRLARDRKKAKKKFEESSTYGRVNEGEGEICLWSRGIPIKRTACAYGGTRLLE